MSSKPSNTEQNNEEPVENGKSEKSPSKTSRVDDQETKPAPQITTVKDISGEVIRNEDIVPSSTPLIVPTHTPTAHRSNTTTKINSKYSTVVIEDISDTDSPVVTTSISRTGVLECRNANYESGPATGAAASSNNNNMALIPVPQIASKTSQMIPIALLRKSSNSASTDECSGGAGLMHLITGNNKVAPAEAAGGVIDSGGLTSPATTVGAVLMLIPKKSDSVCVEIPDLENNSPVGNASENQGDANCQNNQQEVGVRPTQSYDSYEEVCRICHDNPSKMELIAPCLCKGSMSKVHRACLERWLAESAKNSCEICNYEYNTVRKPKYTGCSSLYQWIRHPLSPSDMRNLFFDIACFFILTPLAAISSWLCVVGAQHYTFGEERRRRAKLHNEASALWDVHAHDSRSDASNATWTSVGLLSLTGTLLVAYSVWLFVAIKYHIQAWKEWQQRNYTVTIVPFEDGCMGRPPPPRPPRNQNNNNNGSLLGSSENGLLSNYNFDANPNLLRYSGHNSVMRGRGRNIFRQNHQNRRNYNLPPIFSRSHFLRNPPPGYTISETTLLYQALYGSDSDAFLNENFLAFFADSSDDLTESSSQIAAEYQIPNNYEITGLLPPPQAQEPQEFTSDPIESGIRKVESSGFSTAIDLNSPACSSKANNNSFLAEKVAEAVAKALAASKVVGKIKSSEEPNCSSATVDNNGSCQNDHVVLPMDGDDENNKNQQSEQEKTQN